MARSVVVVAAGRRRAAAVLPLALHAPHAERVAEFLVGDIGARRRRDADGALELSSGAAAAVQHVVQEVDVARRQLERLDLGQLVRRQRRDDFAQRGERVVETLRALSLAHVGHHALRLHVLERRRPPALLGAHGAAAVAAAATLAPAGLLRRRRTGAAVRLRINIKGMS